jgi:hypothetical protein
MKWYKHISDSLDDPFIYELIEEFRGDGYMVFFGIIEIYSREFSVETDWKLTIKLTYLHKKLVISSAQIKKILSRIYKWNISFSGDYVTIFIPKFKELLDESTLKKLREQSKSFRNHSGGIPKSEPTDKEEDKEEDKDKESKKKFSPPSIQEITDYCDQRDNSVDPTQFFNFYTAKNWMIGKNKMMDWRAAVITWERREKPDERKEACER